MSDRSQNLQTEHMANAESFDLSELRALRKPIQHLAEAPVNLSQASIASNNIHRITPKQEARTATSLKQVPSRGLLPLRVSRAFGKGTEASAQGARNGIFKNPYYRYRGGLLARIITFLANLLKVFERLLLRVFRPAGITTKTVNPTAPKEAPKPTKEQLERDERLRRDRDKGRLSVHRS